MTLFTVTGVALVGALLSLLLREAGGRYTALVPAAAGLLLFVFLLTDVGEILPRLYDYAERYRVSEPVKQAFRAVGVGYVTELGSGICRDLGENGIASRLEACGRIAIAALALPTLLRVLDAAAEVLS